MKKYFSLFFMLFASLALTACGGDDNDDPDNPYDDDTSSVPTTLTINGVKIGRIYNTLCEISSLPKEMVFEADFDYGDEGMMAFNLADSYIKSFDYLEEGDDITFDLEIYRFYSSTGAVAARMRYEIEGGSVKVQSVTNKEVVLRFKDFEFVREIGNQEKTFVMSGTMSYKINK